VACFWPKNLRRGNSSESTSKNHTIAEISEENEAKEDLCKVRGKGILGVGATDVIGQMMTNGY
jgi:hypothetical protein